MEEEKPVPVEIEKIGVGSIEETIELTGWIKANQVVDIASKVPGRVESLSVVSNQGGLVDVEEGLEVKKAQQLAVIDHDVYLAEVAAARAGVKAAEVELADAEREKKRMIALYESGSATEQSKDKAVTTANLAAARLSLAKSNLKLAEINLRESTIISPIDGIVTAKHIDAGNLIKAGDRIVTVADMKTVRVIVAVAEKYSKEVVVGTSARIKVDAFPERVFTASVYSIYPALNEQTNTIQAEIRLNNDELLLKPGMFARVTLITKQKDAAVVIPRDVVLGGKIDPYYVYVVNNNIAHKKFVQIGITQADKYEIVDGLKPGQTLVVNGMNFLKDGTKVEVVRIEDIK
jgi:RND family efflux transporter MFP subunit